MSHVLVFSDEFLSLVLVGLGELPAKVSHKVIVDIEDQVDLKTKDPKAYLALVKKSLKEVKCP